VRPLPVPSLLRRRFAAVSANNEQATVARCRSYSTCYHGGLLAMMLAHDPPLSIDRWLLDEWRAFRGAPAGFFRRNQIEFSRTSRVSLSSRKDPLLRRRRCHLAPKKDTTDSCGHLFFLLLLSRSLSLSTCNAQEVQERTSQPAGSRGTNERTNRCLAAWPAGRLARLLQLLPFALLLRKTQVRCCYPELSTSSPPPPRKRNPNDTITTEDFKR